MAGSIWRQSAFTRRPGVRHWDVSTRRMRGAFLPKNRSEKVPIAHSAMEEVPEPRGPASETVAGPSRARAVLTECCNSSRSPSRPMSCAAVQVLSVTRRSRQRPGRVLWKTPRSLTVGVAAASAVVGMAHIGPSHGERGAGAAGVHPGRAMRSWWASTTRRGDAASWPSRTRHPTAFSSSRWTRWTLSDRLPV